MPEEPIDPSTLQGDALSRWYLRSPADIEQERQAAAAQRYQEFFGGYPGADPDPGFDRGFDTAGPDIDPRFGWELSPAERNLDPGFGQIPGTLGQWPSYPNWNAADLGGVSPLQDDSAWGGNSSSSTEDSANAPSDDTSPPPPTDARTDGPQPRANEGSPYTPYHLASIPSADLGLVPIPLADASDFLAPPTFGFGRGSGSGAMPSKSSLRPASSGWPMSPSGVPPVPSPSAQGVGRGPYGGPPTGDGVAHVASPGQGPTGRPAGKSRSSVGHPGFAESLIPIWGSGREAVADFQEGDYIGAGINGLLAASDVFLAEEIAKGLVKGGFYVTENVARKAPYDWDKWVRPWMGDQGFLKPKQHGHHWAIPQNGWGEDLPDFIKNQPWNIKPMPSAEVHGRITGGYKGKPQFNAAQRYWYGTPAWSKVGTFAAVGHPTAAAMAQSDDHE